VPSARSRRTLPSLAEVTTTEVNYTTVSPCFVATAAWGTPLADEIGVLRRLRDRHLRTHPLGRRLVDFYYDVGPAAAGIVGDHPWLAAAVRTALTPVVAVGRWLEER